MCFSAVASYGVAAVLLPVGGYCVAAAWRKNRRFLPLAVVPLLFGLQQLFEAQVWVGFGREDSELVRVGSLGFLFFALAVWPVWIPLAVAVVEPRGRVRSALAALAGCGAMFGWAYFAPVADSGGRALNPALVGHSIRYDFSGVPAANATGWWLWPALYLVTVAGPFLLSSRPAMRPIGVGVVLLAAVSYALFAHASASVWCFFAAILSVDFVYVIGRLPESSAGGPIDAARGSSCGVDGVSE